MHQDWNPTYICVLRSCTYVEVVSAKTIQLRSLCSCMLTKEGHTKPNHWHQLISTETVKPAKGDKKTTNILPCEMTTYTVCASVQETKGAWTASRCHISLVPKILVRILYTYIGRPVGSCLAWPGHARNSKRECALLDLCLELEATRVREAVAAGNCNCCGYTRWCHGGVQEMVEN
jgi:hypothetical protein